MISYLSMFSFVDVTQTIVCRPGKADENGVEVLRWFRDEDVCEDETALGQIEHLTT